MTLKLQDQGTEGTEKKIPYTLLCSELPSVKQQQKSLYPLHHDFIFPSEVAKLSLQEKYQKLLSFHSENRQSWAEKQTPSNTRMMVYWYFPKIAAAICVQHVYNKDVGIKTLPCQHHSFQRCLSSSGGTGCFHSQVCHCYGKQAAHASQLKSSRLKRAQAAAATTVKMLFGNCPLRELYKESKTRGRDAGLVLSHFLAVTNTTKGLISK